MGRKNIMRPAFEAPPVSDSRGLISKQHGIGVGLINKCMENIVRSCCPTVTRFLPIGLRICCLKGNGCSGISSQESPDSITH
jgi:hypothetical protein